MNATTPTPKHEPIVADLLRENDRLLMLFRVVVIVALMVFGGLLAFALASRDLAYEYKHRMLDAQAAVEREREHCARVMSSTVRCESAEHIGLIHQNPITATVRICVYARDKYVWAELPFGSAVMTK